ncbi:acyltransferase [Apilactobacillus nanyangensis]|uniref:acyltransferase n=1 Tax=Apilactobacillus nanyangensis TaxID=2799579 RepID=UPI001944907E|nr:acyltransferase [Apilactobacillus nanyangensis]
MIVLKIIFHVIADVKKLFFKIIYGKSLSIGKKVSWRKSFSLMIENKATVTIGDNCFFNNYCSINAKNNIEIGNNTIFGEGVKVYDHNHRFNNKNDPIYKQGFSEGSVIIGKNCWIGSNVVILKNSKIGNNVVIGAGTIISEDVPDNRIITSDRNNIINKIIYKK